MYVSHNASVSTLNCNFSNNTMTLDTATKPVISPNFLVWKFCGKAQFPYSFEQFARNYTVTVPFHKICTPGNYVKLPYFLQWEYVLHQEKPLETCHVKVVQLTRFNFDLKISEINFSNAVFVFFESYRTFTLGSISKNVETPVDCRMVYLQGASLNSLKGSSSLGSGISARN